MTQTDRVPTRTIQEAVKGREDDDVLDGARPVRIRRTNAQMTQLIEAAETTERNPLLSMAAGLGAGQ